MLNIHMRKIVYYFWEAREEEKIHITPVKFTLLLIRPFLKQSF
jgi:hypothetical protein